MLVLTIVGAAAWIVIPPVVKSVHAAQAKRDYAAAKAAFAHLSVPADFVPLRTLSVGQPCIESRCYRVNQPTRVVGALIPAILRSVGITKAHTLFGINLCHDPRWPHGECQAFGSIDNNAVGVEVEPYLACTTAQKCRWTHESVVLIDGPTPPTSN